MNEYLEAFREAAGAPVLVGKPEWHGLEGSFVQEAFSPATVIGILQRAGLRIAKKFGTGNFSPGALVRGSKGQITVGFSGEAADAARTKAKAALSEAGYDIAEDRGILTVTEKAA